MAVSVQFGTCNDASNVLNKTVTLGTAKSCDLKQPCSVENPYIIVDSGSVSNTDNYAYCGDFGRYYYITGIDELPGHCKGVSLLSDPLMSFKNDIKNLTCNIARNENEQHSQIIDTALCTLAKDEVVWLNFNKSYTRGTSRRFVLVTSA